MISSFSVLLIHGLGRTPLSMGLLGHRLRKGGLETSTFGYLAAVEDFETCVGRLEARIRSSFQGRPYLLVGHSLGTVMIRAVLPRLEVPPAACFLLAPPSHSPRLARRLASNPLFRLLTGEMGQRLADPIFMESLPPPGVPTTVFVGIRGYHGPGSPFGAEPNDGIVALSEARISADHPVVCLPSLHTFIMNARSVATEILASTHALNPENQNPLEKARP